MFKKIILSALVLALVSCQSADKNAFELTGKIRGDYKGYLFFQLEGRKDSVLIRNGKYSYKGIVDYPTRTWISTTDASTLEEVIFVEKGKITADLHIESKEVQGYNVYFITYDTIINSNIQKQQLAFADFMEKNENKQNYKNLYLEETEKVLKTNAKNEFSVDFLSERIRDSVLDSNQLQELYSIIDVAYQNEEDLLDLKTRFFSEPAVEIGDVFPHFELPNEKDELKNTVVFQGNLIFVDFWATWCVPCHEQFPELKEIISDYSSQDFKVIGVALDENKEKWLKVNEAEQIPWLSLIDTAGHKNIAKKFNIRPIPANYLVNPDGVIIEKNIDIEDLRLVLEEYYKE